MADAFISYRRDPSSSQARLVQEMLKFYHKIDAYVDTTRTDSTRVQFPDRLMQAIADAPTFILLLGDTTLESEWVRKEIQRAYELKKHCIPIFQESYKPTISDPAVDYVLSFDGVHLLDKKNIYIDVAIQHIANLVVKSSEVQTQTIVATATTQKLESAGVPKPRIILPEPFDWCYIPAGKVTLTTDAYDKFIYISQNTEMFVPHFWMSKYPITNGQFREFVDDGGYQNELLWTKKGLKYLKEESWSSPAFWNDPIWNQNDYPVVGVSFYEAMAFCMWLRYRTGDTITLPTDAMWQHAAQGDDGRKFPWGNEWNGGFCSNSVKPNFSKKTTAVNQFQYVGQSPYEVIDMAGNSSEWCLTIYTSGKESWDNNTSRIARGGSWINKATKQFTTYYRRRYYPYRRYHYLGFRIVSDIFTT
ncbi:MAG: SUMF1/EgtB/PvdO family nonheme iron enzyme [bacterium]|nr:SUMF1/EgtB/PvdO family nonheme iron enzyme [bacterium]